MSNVNEYKCLTCKAGLKFDPPSQKWKCDYCFNEFDKSQLDEVYQHQETLEEDMPELESYNCKSCGAELIADSTTSATFCIYCKNPTIIKNRFSGKFKPKSVIPFKITKEQAEEIYKTWIKKRLFTPKLFKTKDEIEKITGIYAPFWMFDCSAQGMIDGEATTTNSWTQGSYRYTTTKYYRVTREGHANYEKLPVDCSKKLDDELMHLVEPYNYNDLTDFSMQYMTGFMAERYDVDVDDAKKVMEDRVTNYLETRLKDTAKQYNSYVVSKKVVDLSDVREDYALLPVYLLINKYNDEEYAFIINGQTGKVVGNAPISIIRQLVFAICVFYIIWIIGVFGGALFV